MKYIVMTAIIEELYNNRNCSLYKICHKEKLCSAQSTLSSIVYCSRDISMKTWHCYSFSVKCITVLLYRTPLLLIYFTKFTYNEYTSFCFWSKNTGLWFIITKIVYNLLYKYIFYQGLCTLVATILKSHDQMYFIMPDELWKTHEGNQALVKMSK